MFLDLKMSVEEEVKGGSLSSSCKKFLMISKWCHWGFLMLFRANEKIADQIQLGFPNKMKMIVSKCFFSSSCSGVRPDSTSVPGLGLPPDVGGARLSLRPAPRPPLSPVLPGVWPHPGGGRPGRGQGRGGGRG